MALSQVEAFLQQGFGSLEKPLLLSLRGGSREVSGLGLTDEIAERMALQENANCVWDSYRRLLQSYAQAVVGEPWFLNASSILRWEYGTCFKQDHAEILYIYI